MRLDDERESNNIEDRRGESGGGIGRTGGIGIGTVVIALAASYFLGIDPRVVLGLAESVQNVQHSTPSTQQHRPVDPATDPDDATKREVRKILAKTEDTWGALFRQMGSAYRPPTLVLYTRATATACGAGQAAMGPFYCPGDARVYLDMGFFHELETRFHASGDFARAYVIAHEIGHHVQNLLGVTGKTNALHAHMNETQYNKVSVRAELQADCFAGVWAYHANRAKPFLDPGDIDAALNAATAIGDDKLQQQSRGVVVPDSFTHGSSAQRVRWFKTGFEAGSLKTCDTFAAQPL
ncbi:MAG TPA: neutral zinc metallopeptidase [Usitatibacteraceae bacterium]